MDATAADTTTAEMVKIIENTYRDVNIALANEMKVVLDKMGINVWEVIEAAKTKPFGFMPFYPGPGLGAGSGYLVAKELTKPPITQRLLSRIPGRS